MWGNEYQSDEQKQFEPIPLGQYACYLEDAKLMTKGKNNTDCLNMTFVIADGEHAKRKLWSDMWFTPKTGGIVAGICKSLLIWEDCKPEKNTQFESIDVKAPDGTSKKQYKNMNDGMNVIATKVFALVGKKIFVKVSDHNESNGKVYERTEIVGFADLPNHAVQTVPAGPSPGVDVNEEIPF